METSIALQPPISGLTLESSLPAGGTDPDRFDWFEAWHPVFYVEDLDKTKPTPFTLLDLNLVIWWDSKTKSWRVLEDKCPHRLAPLSEGRIAEDGLLECPYHGWAFTAEGTCDRIPQQPEGGSAETSKRACVRSFPATVRQGLLFVYPGQVENADRVAVPIIDAMEESSQQWVCLNTFRDLPYDALTLLENVLDSSHLPFTHHKSVGNRSNASPVELEVTESGKQGFAGVWEEGPRRGTLGRQTSRFVAPNFMWHDLTSKQFGRTLTVVYATPIRKGECRVFARFPFKFSSKIPALAIGLTPRWYSHIGQNGVLEDDQIFLHHQERYLEQLGGGANVSKAFYLPTKADSFVSALRQWVNQFQADPFPNGHLTPPLSTEALLDRYHSHTKHCASCRTALKRIEQIQTVILFIGAIVWLGTPLLAVVLGQAALLPVAISVSVSGLLGAGWLGLANFKRKFYEGRAVPPRNLPEKRSSKVK
ncbi:aromatic ring-hydroxylating dioxygenase subunit alpha [Leptolyngbya ohadii]|uniref:aromatic ring-hydroxylating dioxygenase subunit alpha n=1 Tax=Leptolyngbya ohadii TaxID=1962290 RepID=UPI000B5995B9|nr:Rieske 2Fe-2S domain-containing protein [Leptolyngbya ohadii]